MNKKGFTLVELLATIAILVLMSVIIGVNITSILRSTEKQNDDFDKKQIEKAACVYVDSSENLGEDRANKCSDRTKECTEVTVKDLIESGLLDDSYESVKSKPVTINWDTDGLKKCTYN